MLIVEVYHTHPVLRAFLELLNQTRANRLESDTPGVIISTKNGAFYLAFVLIHFFVPVSRIMQNIDEI